MFKKAKESFVRMDENRTMKYLKGQIGESGKLHLTILQCNNGRSGMFEGNKLVNHLFL